MSLCCFFFSPGDHRYIHSLTVTFPPRRSSALRSAAQGRRDDHRAARREPVDLDDHALQFAAVPAVPRHRLLRAAPDAEEFGFGRDGFRQKQIGRDTSELQSLMRISYAVFCFKTKNTP